MTSVSYVKELQEDVTADLECLLIRTIGTYAVGHARRYVYTTHDRLPARPI